MMSASDAALRTTRAPTGCNAKVIGMALRPEERTQVEQIAELEMRSLAATSRMLCLKGLAAYRAEIASTPAPVNH